MEKINWTEITREDVIKAIERFIDDNYDYPEARNTYLIYDGRMFPAKHIRGMAYKVHYGREISKNDYNGGAETIRFFKRLGFDVKYFGESEITSHKSKKADTEKTANIQPIIESSGEKEEDISEDVLKVVMYLQTEEYKNETEFNKILPLVKKVDADILVFPENCFVPFYDKICNKDILLPDDRGVIFDCCLQFSSEIGKAVIVCILNNFGTNYSVFANCAARDGETSVSYYVKHTMTVDSCLDVPDYPYFAADIFDPVAIKNFLVGMTICYDCNHALFSRMYGYYGVDLIINSTGGNVIFDKWYKYNKVRAIENNCCTLVTMGGDGTKENSNNYVFGFNKNGGVISPENLNGNSDKTNCSGGLYLYTITKDSGKAEPDNSNLQETENKQWHIEFPVGKSERVLESSQKISENIYCKKLGNENIIFILVDSTDILKPECVQPLLYSDSVKKIPNRRYIIINRHNTVDEAFFDEKLSIVLKVRSMENFCAVILESDNINKCYQCGKNRTAQVVKATDGVFRIDLERTSGPEAIWKNKQGMREAWRKNYEWLVKNAASLYDEY